jgi:hypothetical protein
MGLRVRIEAVRVQRGSLGALLLLRLDEVDELGGVRRLL